LLLWARRPGDIGRLLHGRRPVALQLDGQGGQSSAEQGAAEFQAKKFQK